MSECFQFLLGSNNDEEKPPKTKKIGPFEFNMRYLHSGPGLVKCAQVLFLWIAFFCNVINTSSSPWKSQYGLLVFFTISLVLGALVSSYMLYTSMANMREEECCGVSWRFLELLFYGVYGAIHFLASCLAANKGEGIGNLAASVAFSFLAVITFLLSFITAWKSKKTDEQETKQEDIDEDLPPGVNNYPESYVSGNTLDFENESEYPIRGARLRASQASMKRPQSQLSFGLSMYDSEINPQRRRHFSASDKDSAFSEDFFSPQYGAINPLRMRRTTSAHNLDFRRYPSSQFQPKSNFQNREKECLNLLNRRMSSSYPQQLSANSLTNMKLNYHLDRDDIVSEVESTATQMPGWLRAALEDDDIVENEKPDLALRSRQQSSFFPENSDFSFNSNHQRHQQIRSQTGNHLPARLMSTMSNQTFDNFAEPNRSKTLQYYSSAGRRNLPSQHKSQQMHYPYS